MPTRAKYVGRETKVSFELASRCLIVLLVHRCALWRSLTLLIPLRPFRSSDPLYGGRVRRHELSVG